MSYERNTTRSPRRARQVRVLAQLAGNDFLGNTRNSFPAFLMSETASTTGRLPSRHLVGITNKFVPVLRYFILSSRGVKIETLAIIRDIFLIAATGLFIVMVLVGGVMAFRLYRSVRRSVRNVEEFSKKVVRPLSNILEKVGPLIRLIQQLRSRESRSEDG